ncbi:FAD-dependent oxidoreductase [Vampirovibrio sp.]|uniref:FAD-dependent oxidoreductase n=1 Tax=Vampirovibrio sp. TaxID=2717857 RepID=UPI00359347EC
MADARDPFYAHFENPAESATVSLWKHNAQNRPIRGALTNQFPPLSGSLETDVAIIGAGLTGLSTALLLHRAGYEVAVVDAHPVGYGVTGFNSGHLTSILLDTRFQELIPAFGEASLRSVVRGIEEAMLLIERQVTDYRIDCGFRWLPGYLFAETTEQQKALQQEVEAMAKAGLAANRTFNVPLPFAVEEGVQVSQQAAIDPLRYAQSLAAQLHQEGVPLFENARVTDIESHGREGGHLLKTEGGSIHAKNVVIATHTPIGFRPLSQTRLEPWRSYVIGVRTDSVIADALYWDMADPYHYLRLAEDEQGPLLIIGGADHRTGESRNAEQCFNQLEAFAAQRFNVNRVDYRWSAQFYEPADGLPYIGKSADVYIATGFSGEGLTYGTLAAQLISDLIQGIPNPCADILSPSRTKPIASAGGFLSENLSTVGHFVGDRLKKTAIETPTDVPPGEGAICLVDGDKVAVYHSPEGVFYGFSPVCTHARCLVDWNPTEKSWDCPCHGGRFNALGQVLNGPPVEGLKPVELSPDLDQSL